jgi:dipeptidyl aminopeptidase/acylaminoacyl peptidase
VKTLAALAYVLGGIHAGGHHVLPVGYAPAWSPNAERLAYVTRGNLWVADADGTHRSLLVRDADNPAWAPSGRRLAFSRGGWVWTVRADGLDERRLARGARPAWSPDGLRIAFDRDAEIYSLRWYGGGLRDVVAGTEPAYARDGRLAYVLDGEVMIGGRAIDRGASPAWSPGSRRVAYVRDDAIYVDGRRIAKGHQPAWRPTVPTRELLPDLDQRAPTGLVIGGGPGRWLLGFTSLVYNVGLGPAYIVGRRAPDEPRMTGAQRVLL